MRILRNQPPVIGYRVRVVEAQQAADEQMCVCGRIKKANRVNNEDGYRLTGFHFFTFFFFYGSVPGVLICLQSTTITHIVRGFRILLNLQEGNDIQIDIQW